MEKCAVKIPFFSFSLFFLPPPFTEQKRTLEPQTFRTSGLENVPVVMVITVLYRNTTGLFSSTLETRRQTSTLR